LVARCTFEDERIVRMVIGGILEARLERNSAPRHADGDLFDLSQISVIRLSASLGGRSDQLQELVLRVEGIGGDFLPPTSERQFVTRLSPESCRIETTGGLLASGRDELDAAERMRFLDDAPGIESSSPTIVALAQSLADEDESVLRRAAALQSWVYDRMEPGERGGAPSALATLESGAGDCTEYARLFVALARAAGIPAREVGGLMYGMDEEGPGFTGHAWAQIHDGVRWVDFDPAWNQIGVDAGHICLQVDPGDQSWTQVFCGATIAIESYSIADENP
jgi:hypothetical protein